MAILGKKNKNDSFITSIGSVTMQPVAENKKNDKDEEWIWVEGYKGTNATMMCRDHQFELGKVYTLDNGKDIKACDYGYHLCLNLKDVFRYYPVGNGNRYFKVSALVRKKDAESLPLLQNKEKIIIENAWRVLAGYQDDKLASKSIVLTSEVTRDELYSTIKSYYKGLENAPIDILETAVLVDPAKAAEMNAERTLVVDGYSEQFAKYIAKNNAQFERAHALASVEGLSTDVKVMMILDCKE